MYKPMKNFYFDKYDQHIIEELKKLPKPLKTFDDHIVNFDANKRTETIYEHIANKKHHLHTIDIKQIQAILLNKESLKNDRNGKKNRSYVGKRNKQKEKNKYLKIVTTVNKNKTESVVTICTVKRNI